MNRVLIHESIRVSWTNSFSTKPLLKKPKWIDSRFLRVRIVSALVPPSALLYGRPYSRRRRARGGGQDYDQCGTESAASWRVSASYSPYRSSLRFIQGGCTGFDIVFTLNSELLIKLQIRICPSCQFSVIFRFSPKVMMVLQGGPSGRIVGWVDFDL